MRVADTIRDKLNARFAPTRLEIIDESHRHAGHAGARPEGIVLQHAPSRTHYDGFPDFPLAGPEREMEIIHLLGGKPVVAITLNHEGLTPDEIRAHAAALRARHGIPCCDPLRDGVSPIIEELRRRFPRLPG